MRFQQVFQPIAPLLTTKLPGTARPRDTRILVPEKNRAAQNCAS